MSKTYPILGHLRDDSTPIAWAFVEQFRKRIESNHYQTMEKVAERGGLSWYELWHAVADQGFDARKRELSEEVARQCVIVVYCQWLRKKCEVA